MRKSYQRWILACCVIPFLLATSCNKKSGKVWDDSKTSSRYKQTKSLWGNDLDSDAIAQGNYTPSNEDFIPLQEEDLKSVFADGAIPQADELPGEEGSSIPGIDYFASPSAHLSSIFRSIYFNTNEDTIRGRDSLMIIEKMSSYLKEHPNTYVFIAGHCDERGPEAYNLALGTRRASMIRSLLTQKGANPNQLFTISYGKERPLDFNHTPEAWQKNRRAEFKIYQKSKESR